MKISDKLAEQYGEYYGSERLSRKRAIAAAQTVQHIRDLYPGPVGSLIDIGAGEGAVLSELALAGYAENLHAVEISDSGLAAIKSRKIESLRTVQGFDGYRINAEDGAYDFGISIHVLEHVEHERAFLQEVARVCKVFYIEVPLELTMRVEHSINASRPYGHINFYNLGTFHNLLDTAGLEIVSHKVFSNSFPYERFVSGRVRGALKYIIRESFLRSMPGLASHLMTYLAGAICQRKKSDFSS